MKNAERSCILAAIELTLAPGIGYGAQNRIWQACHPIDEVFALREPQLEALGLQLEPRRCIIDRRYRKPAAEIEAWAAGQGCCILLRGSADYPLLLNEIHDPPLILYGRGSLALLNRPAVAIVGTRRPTFYGLQMAEGLASDIGSRGVIVVSGLARGIDAAAHRGCLAAKGQTMAILGCGIDVVYPREHRRLSADISENGLLLSEFVPGTSPSPQNFPVRNRIISGLSLGTLIVEANEYSGSLITARLAMEQNREVFAIPGNLTSVQSFGPNYLIKQGCKLVQSWRDIVEEFPPEIRHEILAKEDAAAPPLSPKLQLLSNEELKVLELLSPDNATQFDKIYGLSGLEISRLSDLLLHLEMGGWIRQLPGNLYIRVSRPAN